MSTSEEHTSELQACIRDLEAERARTSAETERLRAENHELRHLLEIKGPDIVRTLEARDAAMQKLHRAQRFIQDLLDERRTRLQADGAAAAEGSGRHRPEADSSGDDSWDKVEPVEQDAGSRMTAAAKAAPSKAANATPLEITADRTSLSESASGYRQGERTEAVHTKQPAPQAQTREDRAAGSSASTAPLQDSALEGWYIEYSRPPATAVLTTTTSLTYAELQERLRLDDETMLSIESLENMQTPGMRVQIHGDLMFLCQPIVLEGPDSTYLVDWGEEAVNEGTVKYLTQNECRPVNTVFHAFVNPKAQDAWWYLGAHKLSPADTPSVWHKIMWQKGEERKELALVLSARWKAPLGIKDIARRIRTHELKQCCLELRSDGLRAESVTFTERVLKMKYRVLDEEEAG